MNTKLNLSKSDVQAFDSLAIIYAERYLSKKILAVVDSLTDARQCSELSYEFARVMMEERKKVLNEIP